MRMFFVLPALTLAAACSSPGRQAAWEVEKPIDGAQTTQTSSAAQASLEAQALEHWSKRDAKEELQQAITTWEKIVAADARNVGALVHLARAYYFLVDGHIALEGGETDEQQLALYEKGSDYGEKALIAVEPDFEKSMREGAEFEAAIVKITDKGIEPTYWYCANLGRFAAKKGLSTRLFYKDRIKAAMERILELKPDYFYAAADRYFGAFYAILPSIAGKDLDKSAEHFKKAITLSPQYLPTKVIQAQFLATDLEDRKMYEELLNAVLKGEDTDNPDISPENRAAKRTAKKMLAEIDDKF